MTDPWASGQQPDPPPGGYAPPPPPTWGYTTPPPFMNMPYPPAPKSYAIPIVLCFIFGPLLLGCLVWGLITYR